MPGASPAGGRGRRLVAGPGADSSLVRAGGGAALRRASRERPLATKLNGNQSSTDTKSVEKRAAKACRLRTTTPQAALLRLEGPAQCEGHHGHEACGCTGAAGSVPGERPPHLSFHSPDHFNTLGSPSGTTPYTPACLPPSPPPPPYAAASMSHRLTTCPSIPTLARGHLDRSQAPATPSVSACRFSTSPASADDST